MRVEETGHPVDVRIGDVFIKRALKLDEIGDAEIVAQAFFHLVTAHFQIAVGTDDQG